MLKDAARILARQSLGRIAESPHMRLGNYSTRIQDTYLGHGPVCWNIFLVDQREPIRVFQHAFNQLLKLVTSLVERPRSSARPELSEEWERSRCHCYFANAAPLVYRVVELLGCCKRSQEPGLCAYIHH